MQLANRSIRAVCTTNLGASVTVRIVSDSSAASNSGRSIRGTLRAKQIKNENARPQKNSWHLERNPFHEAGRLATRQIQDQAEA